MDLLSGHKAQPAEAALMFMLLGAGASAASLHASTQCTDVEW